MRNLNIGRTNHYVQKQTSPASSFSSAGCYAQCGQQLIHTKPGFCWFAIICKLPPWTHWHGKHLGLRSLKRWIAKLRHAPAPTEISGKPPIDFNGNRIQSLFSGSKTQRYLSFLEHMQLWKSVPLGHSKIFPICLIPWQHNIITELSILKWDFTTKPEDLYKCIL